MTVSERIKELRKKENLSQSEFAEKLNVSRSTIVLIEQSKREISTKMLEAIKNEFKISADWVLFGECEEKIYPERIKSIALATTHMYQVVKPILIEVLAAYKGHMNGQEKSKFAESKQKYYETLFLQQAVADRDTYNLITQALNFEPPRDYLTEIMGFSNVIKDLYSTFYSKITPITDHYAKEVAKDFWKLEEKDFPKIE